jgi:hypothetical protein
MTSLSSFAPITSLHCRICGDFQRTAHVRWRPSKRQTLCRSCNADTPRKVSRHSFDVQYWGTESANVPESTKRDFYADYLASTCTFRQYVLSTTGGAV